MSNGSLRQITLKTGIPIGLVVLVIGALSGAFVNNATIRSDLTKEMAEALKSHCVEADNKYSKKDVVDLQFDYIKAELVEIKELVKAR